MTNSNSENTTVQVGKNQKKESNDKIRFLIIIKKKKLIIKIFFKK